MSVRVAHPPGRAGRMWLQGRLAVAELGCEQLSRKLRALLPEQERRRHEHDERMRTWTTSLQLARHWELRAGMLSGQTAYTGTIPTDLVRLEVDWRSTVGVRLPESVRRVGPEVELSSPAANAAVVHAAEAFRAALLAGAELALAEEALRRVDAEVGLTRRRLRGLEKRWLPALRNALALVEQSLELAEQDDGGLLRKARRGSRLGRTTPAQ